MQVRRGVTRTVFITKRYAIKLPRLYDCKGHKAWTFDKHLVIDQMRQVYIKEALAWLTLYWNELWD